MNNITKQTKYQKNIIQIQKEQETYQKNSTPHIYIRQKTNKAMNTTVL